MYTVSDPADRSPDPGPSAESHPKRRRSVRKGTRSCWQCKRRKIRCSFLTPSDSECIGCRRRGAICVSQDNPEEIAIAASSLGGRGPYVGDRIVRVEALIEQLAKQVGNSRHPSTVPAISFTSSEDGRPSLATSPTVRSDGGQSTHTSAQTTLLTSNLVPTVNHSGKPWSPPETHNPASSTPASLHTTTTTATAASTKGTEYGQLSANLRAALPPLSDINLMIEAGIDISFHELVSHPHAVSSQSPTNGRADLKDIPDAKAHPTLIAKYMLILATCLQYSNPELHADAIRRLSEPPRQLMTRLAETAMNLVTNKDEFIVNIEGLECVMLETMYQANAGNLRRAWFACRRAMVVAQTMGLHRNGNRQALEILDPETTAYPSYFWFRIVWFDRQLSLMLSLPQGSLDVSMATEAALAGATPSDRFERKQTAISARILERNESSDPSIPLDLIVLQEIDAELQNAANEMPSKWWLPPNLANITNDPGQAFWQTLRLLEQMIYFNLLNVLHLPHMLRSTAPGAEGSRDASANYEYSKLASVNASRELLTRFVTFRSFNRVAFCCRSSDFQALTAAMTLVIAHLDGHRKQREHQRNYGLGISGGNVLAHQRNSDRAMMEQVLESMEGVSKLSTDALSDRSSSLLGSLLNLEADAAKGKYGNADTDYLLSTKTMMDLQPDSAKDDGQSLRLGIPYFGTIRIDREGIISLEAPLRTKPLASVQQKQVPTGKAVSLSSFPVSEPNNAANHANLNFGAGSPVPDQSLDGTSSNIAKQPQQTASKQDPVAQLHGIQAQTSFAPQFPSEINDTLQQEYLYPGLTAGADDWAFQGVDMAFFDNLMRGSGAEDGGSWTDWEGVK
ncbi:hypothetical protein G7046_g6584 [Stylonectria norvegica]|nr:hypothetical protein G7046_g6584 [Stylonectria norvegica]